MILECVYNSANRNATTFVSKLLINTIWHEIILGIKFYNFTVAGSIVKSKSINFYYLYVAKILSCFDSVKFKIC